ncbi:MAG: sulfate ABC transporter permease subunit CysT [Kiritimatiellia bacterium]
MSLIAKSSPRVIPGFGLTMGVTLTLLSLVVLLPLAALVAKTATGTWQHFSAALLSPRVLAAFRLTFSASFAAALINAVFGLLLAWVLTRYHFPGRTLVDGLVDLPFALPTAVAGIALTAAYAPNGIIGKPLAEWGIKVAYTPVGITIALVFIGLPFVVRTVQPVLQDLDEEVEEAAAILGASRIKVFLRVIFPTVFPSLLTGFALSFARALGEYGSVVFISGNISGKTEIVPLLIMTKLDQYDYTGATALAVGMLALSFLLLFVINLLQRWSRKS